MTGSFFYIQKKNSVTRTLVLIVTMAISRDMVVVAAVYYRKQCPATRDTQDMQIPKYDHSVASHLDTFHQNKKLLDAILLWFFSVA